MTSLLQDIQSDINTILANNEGLSLSRVFMEVDSKIMFDSYTFNEFEYKVTDEHHARKIIAETDDILVSLVSYMDIKDESYKAEFKYMNDKFVVDLTPMIQFRNGIKMQKIFIELETL